MRVYRPLLLMLAALTAGCAETEPFVYNGSGLTRTVAKPRDTILDSGHVYICFNDQMPWADVTQLAAERCGRFGLKPYSYSVTRWQCRATAPHEATFRCFDPEMLTEKGQPVNAFSPAEVQAWERRTGKKAKPHNNLLEPELAPPAGPTEGAAAAPNVPNVPVTTTAPAMPAPASSPAPIAPLTPADIAGRPAMPSAPLAAPPNRSAPAQGAYPTDGFTLPQGSWGDSFQE